MNFPAPDPDEFQLALNKSREFFEKLTWDELRETATVDTLGGTAILAAIEYGKTEQKKTKSRSAWN